MDFNNLRCIIMNIILDFIEYNTPIKIQVVIAIWGVILCELALRSLFSFFCQDLLKITYVQFNTMSVNRNCKDGPHNSNIKCMSSQNRPFYVHTVCLVL